MALVIEIIIVTVIGWMVMEPVAVNTTKALIPSGYDSDRMAMLSIGYQSLYSEDFDSAYFTNEEYAKAQKHLLNMIRDRPDVEKATFATVNSFDQSGSMTWMLDADSVYSHGEEENMILTYKVSYIPDTDFFETFGIKDINGKIFNEQGITENSFIVTESLLKARYADGDAFGKDVFDYDEEDEEDHHTPIVGIIKDISYQKGKGRTAIAISPLIVSGFNNNINGIAVRLADGVNPRAFIDRISNEIDQYRSGNLYLSRPTLYSDKQDTMFKRKEIELTKDWVITTFFLVNVFLGVAGTFYVQCKTRIPDAGVMRAFGATRRRIEWNLIGEAWMTVILGWLIGSGLYLIYLKVKGFPFENDADHAMQIINPIWYDTPAERYTIIGGIVLLLLLATATLGAWLPARKVGRVNPVEALRDE